MGVDVAGFDPTFFPDEQPRRSDVVNLGYVINVIEDVQERAATLTAAWQLASELLIVSARLQGEANALEGRTWRDGLITGRDTFQKFYTQEELRTWVEEQLAVESIAAEPGIFYVFRDPRRAQEFLLTRIRRPRRPGRRDVVFHEHQDILEEFMVFLEENGRIPRTGEFVQESELRERVGTPRQAFQIVKTVTGEERWDRVRVARYEDLLVYLALSRFRRRPRFSHLPDSLQNDIKEFFGNYKAACEQADRALFAIGEQARVVAGINAAPVGKRVRGSLYVHTSALSQLPTVLRVLEGCARELLGTVTDATIVRFDAERPRLAYLQYPEFDGDPHPRLRGAYVATLESLNTDFVDYSESANPPVLHRKELFVSDDHPLRERFARLTKQEERAGLFQEPSRIGTLKAWESALADRGFVLKGHRLVRR